eukprot:974790-Prorocentrum_minimum.AAC.2
MANAARFEVDAAREGLESLGVIPSESAGSPTYRGKIILPVALESFAQTFTTPSAVGCWARVPPV